MGWLCFLSAAVITLLAKQRSARATAVVVASEGILLLCIPDYLAHLRTTYLAGVLLGLLLPVVATIHTLRVQAPHRFGDDCC